MIGREAPPKLLIPDLVQRFWRRRRVFAAAFAAVLGLSVLALAVLPVRYLATGSIIVAEQEPNLTEAQAAWAQKIGDPADLESQLLVIRSPRVLRLAMTAPGATDAAVEDCLSNSRGLLFGSTARCERLKTDSAAFVDYIQNRYAIGAVGRSRVINISYSSGLPQVAQAMANALTTSFLDDQRAAGSNSREAAASWLRQELDRLDRELKETDEKIQAFRRTKGLMRGATAPISSERLTSISQQLSAAEAARADAAARLKEVRAAQAEGSSDVPAVLASRTVADLKQQLTSIGAQYASLSNQLGPRHPSLLALEREQASIKQRLADEVASVAASLQKTYDTNDALVGSLKSQMDSIKAEVGSATSDEASIESMVRAAEIKRQQYSDLYRRASELETERRVLLGSTRLVSLAELPTVPFFPKKLPFLAAGSTLALLLAIAAVLLSEQFAPVRTAPTPPRLEPVETPRPPVEAATEAPAVFGAEPTIGDILAPFQARSPQAPPLSTQPPADEPGAELAAVIGARVLASLPSLEPGSSESPIHAILSGRSPSALGRTLEAAMHDRACQDALATLVTELKLAPASRRQVIVTSAAAGQGATLLTLALARFVAGTGCRVLAIECNLIHPAFHEVLPAVQHGGLLAVLRGDATPQDAVAATGVQNLDVIAAGAAAGRQTDWLLRQDISVLLDWARKSYDVVLVDGPPSAFLADARIPLSRLDGALICVRPGRSSIGQIVAASSAIRSLGGTVLGLAMNDPGGDEIDRDGAASMNQLDRAG